MSEAARTEPKDASAAVIARQDDMRAALPFDDTRDFDEARRGFLGTVENAETLNPAGKPVWSLKAFGFLGP